MFESLAANNQDKDYIGDKMKSASWLIKSIQQRQRTILRVTEKLVERQTDFFEKGIEYLKPMVLRDIAEDIGMHESTISRVTSNKYVHTPQGIFELKYFFNSSVSRAGGEDLASASVKKMIADIIKGENPKKPLLIKRLLIFLMREGFSLPDGLSRSIASKWEFCQVAKERKFFSQIHSF